MPPPSPVFPLFTLFLSDRNGVNIKVCLHTKECKISHTLWVKSENNGKGTTLKINSIENTCRNQHVSATLNLHQGVKRTRCWHASLNSGINQQKYKTKEYLQYVYISNMKTTIAKQRNNQILVTQERKRQ